MKNDWIWVGRLSAILMLMVVLGGLTLPAGAQVIVEAWGDNSYDQLGNGSTASSSSVPVMVSGLSSGVTAIAAGELHGLAAENGNVYAWGYNADGELGNGTTMKSAIPVAVSGLSGGVSALSGGDEYSLAIQNSGVYAWGYNGSGQLGNGTTMNSSVPVAVSGLSSGVTEIAAGYHHSLAVRNGGAYAWGYNVYGDLGNGMMTNSSVPVPVSGLSSGVTAIAAGEDHSLAVYNGGVYAWGKNLNGQLGNGTTTVNSQNYGIPTPAAVSGLSSGVSAVAAGALHSLALRNGNVYAWGYNNNGQLGDGTTLERLTPEEIDPTDLNHIVAVAANSFGFSSYALSADGSIWDWGENYVAGQLGLGTTTYDYLTPQHLLPPSGYVFTSISATDQGAVATLASVPEPASLLLLAVGSLSLLHRRMPARSSVREIQRGRESIYHFTCSDTAPPVGPEGCRRGPCREE